MIEDLKTAASKVEYLLERHVELRDGDKKLWIAYLNIFCGLKNRLDGFEMPHDPYKIFVEVVNSAPSMESIRRSRQKIQETGRYLGEKRSARLEESERVRGYMR